MVLEKDGEDQLGQSCEKLRSVTQNQGGEEYPTYEGWNFNSGNYLFTTDTK